MTDLLTVYLAGFGIMVTLLLGTIGLLLRLIGDVRADMREHRESTRADMREFGRAIREIGYDVAGLKAPPSAAPPR